jgi:hypothetical protein
MFAIGEKIVYIGNIELHPEEIEDGVRSPIKNEIYTVRNFGDSDEINHTLRVEEIVNPILEYEEGLDEKAWYFHHFRKLDHQFAEDLLSEITRKVKEESLSLTEH